jgi:hypothetical protein
MDVFEVGWVGMLGVGVGMGPGDRGLGRGRERKYNQTWQITRMWHIHTPHTPALYCKDLSYYSERPNEGTLGPSPPPDIVLLLSG